MDNRNAKIIAVDLSTPLEVINAGMAIMTALENNEHVDSQVCGLIMGCLLLLIQYDKTAPEPVRQAVRALTQLSIGNALERMSESEAESTPSEAPTKPRRDNVVVLMPRNEARDPNERGN